MTVDHVSTSTASHHTPLHASPPARPPDPASHRPILSRSMLRVHSKSEVVFRSRRMPPGGPRQVPRDCPSGWGRRFREICWLREAWRGWARFIGQAVPAFPAIGRTVQSAPGMSNAATLSAFACVLFASRPDSSTNSPHTPSPRSFSFYAFRPASFSLWRPSESRFTSLLACLIGIEGSGLRADVEYGSSHRVSACVVGAGLCAARVGPFFGR